MTNFESPREFSVKLALVVATAVRAATGFLIPALSSAVGGAKTAILMEYGTIARNILGGYGFAYSWPMPAGDPVILQSAYMPPGQVWIDTACLWLFGPGTGGVYAVFAINVALGVLGVYLIWKIAMVLFESERIGLIALWASAIYPPFLYATVTFGVSNIVVALNAIIILETIKAVKNSEEGSNLWKRMLTIGAALGVLTYFRGETPLLIAATGVYLLWVWRKRLARVFPKVAFMVVVAGAIIAPWTIRNYIAFDRFILTSTNGGFNFYRGNNPVITGGAWTPDGHMFWGTDEQWAKAQRWIHSGGEYEHMISDMFYSDALEWMGAHPMEAIALDLKKGFIFWTIDPMSPMGKQLAYVATYLITLVLLIAATVQLVRAKLEIRGLGVLVVWTAVATLVATLFFPMPRLQVIMIAGYFPIVAYGIDCVWSLARREPRFV